MNNEELQQLTEELSWSCFQKPFRHEAIFNKRLRSVGGRYLLSSHNIEINYKYFEHYGKEEIIGIIKHELCHYHLHLEGRGYMHRDADFKRLLKNVGAPRFCTPLPSKEKKERKIHCFRCTSCGTEYRRKRNVNINKYVCGKCKGKLKKI
ncbi:MAG: SprT family protein [Bacillus sp. (in: firmicutes)]